MTLRICVLSDPMSHRRHSRASWNTVSRSTTSLDRSSTAWTAVATGSMTNIMALNDRGEVVANLMINTMPSWQRYDEGKVEIHNGGGGGRSTGNGNLERGGGLASFVNYQCAPTCRRVPDPAENASSATSGTETSTTVINSR